MSRQESAGFSRACIDASSRGRIEARKRQRHDNDDDGCGADAGAGAGSGGALPAADGAAEAEVEAEYLQIADDLVPLLPLLNQIEAAGAGASIVEEAAAVPELVEPAPPADVADEADAFVLHAASPAGGGEGDGNSDGDCAAMFGARYSSAPLRLVAPTVSREAVKSATAAAQTPYCGALRQS